MNFKLILKTLFVIALLALLVIMGMNNLQHVALSMSPPIPWRINHVPAALMYFGFFGVGFLSGTILMAGGKKGGSGGKSKAQT